MPGLLRTLRETLFPPLPPPAGPLEGDDLRRRVRQIELRARRVLRDQLAGEYRSAFRGSGLEFAEVRPYAAGDDVRSIDWKATARLRAPFVRRYVEEREQTVLLVVDVSASTNFGRSGRSVRDVSLEIAAAIGLAASRSNDHVGAVAFSDRIELSIAPARQHRHVLRIIRDLLTRSGEGTDLAGALDYALRLLRRSAIVILVSDFSTAEPAAAWQAALRRLGLRHDVVAIAVRDPHEAELPGRRPRPVARRRVGRAAARRCPTRCRAVRGPTRRTRRSADAAAPLRRRRADDRHRARLGPAALRPAA